MNNRIPPSEKISKEIKQLIGKLDQRFSNEDLLGRILKLGMAKIVQWTEPLRLDTYGLSHNAFLRVILYQ